MRDGVKLYTVIYKPKKSAEKSPILITRSPYSCSPYGPGKFADIWKGPLMRFLKSGYIYVKQDVRGRYMSEGFFVDVRPHNPLKKGLETDESSDSYDTIEWLVKNLENNNGRVGVFGISYPGFYSTMAALSGHPALKAVSPQAPVTDWFIGDDFHHNGAFMLMDAFGFFSEFGVPRPEPTEKYNQGYQIKDRDKYRFYLDAGPLPQFNKKFLGDSIGFWNDLMRYETYDYWWQARDTRRYVSGLKPAMLVVGGQFDAEDVFGAWNLYKAIEKTNPSEFHNKIVMGPWFHGAWGGRSTGEMLGNIAFGSKTSEWYQSKIEFPFFEHFLREASETPLAEATVFFSGENKWRQFDTWPPANMVQKPLYLHGRHQLSMEHPKPLGYRVRPDSLHDFSIYHSDPANPVPHEGPDTILTRTREYMVGDQRFAQIRPDVLHFATPVLTEEITLGGLPEAELWVSMGSTDADFVVKIIDVFPENISQNPQGADTVYMGKDSMNGFQMLVRGEVMRGKFRNSFEKPEPFIPNKITRVKFSMPDVAHTFQKGHKIMVQIQSSWFPLVDRNPQTFTNIYKANESDFKATDIRVFHTEGLASKILLPILEH